MKTQDTILITGASRGLGLELAKALASKGHNLVMVARQEAPLQEARKQIEALFPSDSQARALAIAADVSQNAEDIVAEAIWDFGKLSALVNNASTVGPSPMPELALYPWQLLSRVLTVNTLAPLHLMQLSLPHLREDGVIVNITSDAGVNRYPGWGGYGASKAALEHLSETFAKETGLRTYLVDPGDMNTQMHREAEPGVDLSHLPGPEAAVPALLRLLLEKPEGFHRVEAQREPVAL